MRIKDIVNIRNEKTQQTDLPYIALENIKSWDASFIETDAVTEGINNIFKSGDILFGKLRPYLAKGYIPEYDGICSSEFLVMNAKKGYSNKYLLYYFLSHSVIDYIRNQVAGVKMPRTNWNSFSSIEIEPPTYAEQQRVVDYLDEKTKAIDARISVLEKKSDAYTRLKASVINRAVTRGLNPNVTLKDSGIEWIGMIPEHWEVKRMKEIFSERKEVSTTGKEDLLSVSEYYGVARRKDKMTSDEEFESRAESLVGYKICKANDLVMNIMLAWKTGLGISDYDGIVSPAYAVYEGKGIIPHFYHYLLRTGLYVTEYKRHSKGIIDSRLRLYNDRFNNVIAIYPPIAEQQSIATYLDTKCSEIDKAIDNIGKQIDALKRLKRSLINEVVTGKRKI